MDTKPSEIINSKGQHIKVSPWRTSDGAAVLSPLTLFEPLESLIITAGINRARTMGYTTLYTGAIPDRETGPFYQCGFTLKEQLHVLRRPVVPLRLKPVEGIRIKKPTFYDLDLVAELDAKCFDSFWTMNVDGLLDAEAATTRARFRIAIDRTSGAERIVGYAIMGLGERRGYLQRLAVDLDFQRRGIASGLVEDGISWLRFWRAQEVFVNTQTKNEGALSFYLGTGFVLTSERLNILELDLHA